jgi:quinol monooxygenase YgiN
MNIIIKRNLKDFDAWKKIVSEADGTRKGYGSKGATVYRNASDPNEVYLLFEWDDRQSYLNYFNRPDVQKALADTGKTEVIVVSESFRLDE